MEAKSLGWLIHEKACHLLRTLDERIEDQFEWVTEALAEAKKTLAEPTIQLIPKTPSEKKKRLRIWRRHGAAPGYRRFSNSRTSSFRGSYVPIKKSSPDFSNTEISSICRTDLMDNFSETTPNPSWLNRRQLHKPVAMVSVAVQADNIFVPQSIEPVCRLLGSGEPGISKECGCNKTVSCNGTQSAKHLKDTAADLFEFLTKASNEKSSNSFYSRREGGFSAEKFDLEINCLMLDRDEVMKCISSQLVDKILPLSTSDEFQQFTLLQTKIHTFEHDPHLQSIVLTFKKTFASESWNGGREAVFNGNTSKGGSEAVFNGDTSEAMHQTSEQILNGLRNKAESTNSPAEQRIQKEIFPENNLSSPIKTCTSPAPEIVDSTIPELGPGIPAKRPAGVHRSSSSSSVSSLSSAGSRFLDSLDVRVSVGTDAERYSTNENRDSIYCAVAYDSNEQNTIAPASAIGSCDVSGIEAIADDPMEHGLNAGSGICCSPSLFSLSKICGTEIDSDDEDVKSAMKKTMKRQSKAPGGLRSVKQRPSYVMRTSISGRKSLVKASPGRKSLLRSRLTAAQKNSFAANQNLAINVTSAKPNTGHYTEPSTAKNNRYGSGSRIYKSARRRSSALAIRPAPGISTTPSLRYQVQKTSARKDLPTGDGMATRKSGGKAVGKGGSPRRSITRVTPVAVSKSRILKLRKLFSPLSKSKTLTPNGAVPTTLTLTPRPAPPTLQARQSQLQMWRGAELSALAPGSPSAGKTWYKASPFMHCFNTPRRSSVMENPRIKGRLAAGTIASCSKSANRFTKASQKVVTPSSDAEQSATPRRGLFKRLQDKMKTPGKESPRACLTPVPQPHGGPLCHIRQTTKVFSATKLSDPDNATTENFPSLKVQTSTASVVCSERTKDCVASDVGTAQSVGTVEQGKTSQDSEFKILIDVCSLDPFDDDPLIIASSDAVSSYDISDLQPDSDDADEDPPSIPQNKTQVRMVPLWAEGKRLAQALVELDFRSLDLEKMFGRVIPPNLNEMFDKKKPRFDKRTSSANWEHPLDLRPFQL